MDDQLRELVALGKEHFQRGDYSLAAGHLEQAVAAFAELRPLLLGEGREPGRWGRPAGFGASRN